MERLIDKIITKACNDPWDLCELDSVCKRDCYKPTPCKIPHVVYRLAQIEDIIGDTYDLYRLRELVEADKDGWCVVLPCKPDDMVYIVCGFISEYEVKQLIYDGIFIWAWLVNEKYQEPYKLIKRCLDFDVGKTIFFTREAAKAALTKEGQNNADQKLYDEN